MKRLLDKIPSPLISVVVFLIICYLTLTPQPLPPSILPTFIGWDKVAHFFMFGTWTALTLWDVGRRWRVGRAAAAGIIAGVVVVGGAIELLQGTSLINRACDLPDFVANSLGAIVVGTVAYFYLRR